MGFSEFYNYYWYEMADERTMNWPLISSIYQIPLISLIYLYFVTQCGPRFMKDRPPYSLKTFIKYYNIFQIVANSWIVYRIIDAGWFTEITIYCEPAVYTYDRNPYMLAKTLWWVALLKLSDLVETGVFVLRKKNNQISGLHLYHHISTLWFAWICTRYVAGGMALFFPLVNCTVHVIMYTYYYLAALGPNIQKWLNPYKRFVTIIQMVQFWLLFIYGIQGMLPSCPVPKLPAYLMLPNLSINFALFLNFYINTYKHAAKKEP